MDPSQMKPMDYNKNFKFDTVQMDYNKNSKLILHK